MEAFLSLHYEWLRALHIISVIAWMAGLLYLPRLFIYHILGAPKASDQAVTFKTMERKLYHYIMNPAMISSWLFGALMLWANPAMLSQGWMHVKLAAIFALTGFHYLFGHWVNVFAADENKRGDGFYRVMNEMPTILMIIIVIMAVLQPF